jgi:hypothetical protein
MPDPNFLIIGAQKCGTSWLAANLKQHPEILLSPNKELHFFDKEYNYARGLEWYQGKFGEYRGQKAVGEATPNYFWAYGDADEMKRSEHLPGIPRRIHQQYPDLKLIVSFRDPVERAISAYYHLIRSRRIAPAKRILSVSNQYGITAMGFYYSQLCEWLKYYKAEQFLVLIYEEDIVSNKDRTMSRVLRFLGVDESFKAEELEKGRNVRMGNFYLFMNYYFPNLTERFIAPHPSIGKLDFPKIRVSDGEVRELRAIYADENRKLESLIGRKISSWKT